MFDGLDVTADEIGVDGVAGPGPSLMDRGGVELVVGAACGNSFSGVLTGVPPKNGMIDLLPLDLQPIVNKQLKTTTERKNGVPETLR